jgi:hypothetical protein
VARGKRGHRDGHVKPAKLWMPEMGYSRIATLDHNRGSARKGEVEGQEASAPDPERYRHPYQRFSRAYLEPRHALRRIPRQWNFAYAIKAAIKTATSIAAWSGLLRRR